MNFASICTHEPDFYRLALYSDWLEDRQETLKDLNVAEALRYMAKRKLWPRRLMHFTYPPRPDYTRLSPWTWFRAYQMHYVHDGSSGYGSRNDYLWRAFGPEDSCPRLLGLCWETWDHSAARSPNMVPVTRNPENIRHHTIGLSIGACTRASGPGFTFIGLMSLHSALKWFISRYYEMKHRNYIKGVYAQT